MKLSAVAYVITSDDCYTRYVFKQRTKMYIGFAHTHTRTHAHTGLKNGNCVVLLSLDVSRGYPQGS